MARSTQEKPGVSGLVKLTPRQFSARSDSDGEFGDSWAAKTRDLLNTGDSSFETLQPRAIGDERPEEEEPAASKARRRSFALRSAGSWVNRW